MNNVTDEEYFLCSGYLTDSVGVGGRYYEAPRMLGATVSNRRKELGRGGL